jgi:hypothetical protein
VSLIKSDRCNTCQNHELSGHVNGRTRRPCVSTWDCATLEPKSEVADVEPDPVGETRPDLLEPAEDGLKLTTVLTATLAAAASVACLARKEKAPSACAVCESLGSRGGAATKKTRRGLRTRSHASSACT